MGLGRVPSRGPVRVLDGRLEGPRGDWCWEFGVELADRESCKSFGTTATPKT